MKGLNLVHRHGHCMSDGLSMIVERERTEDFPALAKPLSVLRVDNIRYGMAVIVVPVPDGSYAALSAEVEEV